jgi:hypothetical protein
MSLKGLFLASFLGMIVAGCSNEEVEEVLVSQAEQNAIGFNVLNSVSTSTRATLINSSNLTANKFAVWALTNDSTFFMGNAVTSGSTSNLGGVQIQYNTSAWAYSDANDIAYWPTTDNKLNFYAVSPVNGTLNYTWNVEGANKTIAYTTNDEYSDAAINDNVDAMYAVKLNQISTSNSGTVKMQFRHILSNVAFKATTDNASITVDIESIKLRNVAKNGTFTIPASEAKPASTAWATSNVDTLTLIKGQDLHITNAATTDITVNAPMLVVPQTLTKWGVASTKTTIAEADNAGQSYLAISCKTKQNGVCLFGANDKFETLYVPFGADFQPGNRYTYTIHFGGGYDVNGNPILKPITFDAEVTDWDSSISGDIQNY